LKTPMNKHSHKKGELINRKTCMQKGHSSTPSKSKKKKHKKKVVGWGVEQGKKGGQRGNTAS